MGRAPGRRHDLGEYFLINGTIAKMGAEKGTREIQQNVHAPPVSHPFWFCRNSTKYIF